MNVFGENYAKYYNLLYKDKNYKKEYEYIDSLIKKFCKLECKSVLDIGCGTGKHLKNFKDSGYNISGVDLSESMISEAKKYLSQEKELLCSSASDFNFGKKYDVIISLFHVISYQTENEEIEKIFNNVNKHLNNGGLFIFDFWYGPAVLTDPPVVRIKRLEDKDVKVTRLTEPIMDVNKNIVDVNFEVMIENKDTNIIERVNEIHKMRYFFLPELELYINKAGFKINNCFEWMKSSSLSFKTWYGVLVVSK